MKLKQVIKSCFAVLNQIKRMCNANSGLIHLGGAKGYLADSRMTGGFALVAWPAQYAKSGVMTFVVNRDATLYEKDFGPDTDAVVKAMIACDPGEGWEAVR